jgi:hypothetical protein
MDYRRVDILREMQRVPATSACAAEGMRNAEASPESTPPFSDPPPVDYEIPSTEIFNNTHPASVDNAQNSRQEHLEGTEGSAICAPRRIGVGNTASYPNDRSPHWAEQTPKGAAPLSDARDTCFGSPLGPLQRVSSYQNITAAAYQQVSLPDQETLDIDFQSPHATAPRSVWPSQFKEHDILQWIDVFFDRLHGTLPVVDKTLYRDLMLRQHHVDRDFAALVLSLCSLSVVGPIYQKERPSTSARMRVAKEMLASAANLRTSYDFGEQANLEVTTVTSFFMVCH